MTEGNMLATTLTPKEIVSELDRYIIGQKNAKKAVAIALRNRYRCSRLPENMKEEVYPKNIIMIGATGVGKTEIARRLAKIVKAPFIKVEASKFTEVGYVGRDVESMIRELLDVCIRMVKEEKLITVEDRASKAAEERLVNYLMPKRTKKDDGMSVNTNSIDYWMQQANQILNRGNGEGEKPTQEELSQREIIMMKLQRQELEDDEVEIEVSGKNSLGDMFAGNGMNQMNINMQEMLGDMMPKKTRKMKVKVSEARKILTDEEALRLVENESVEIEAIKRVEKNGIVFLDEIDKIAGNDSHSGPDISRGGVQRDILPIVEGTTVVTKYGPVKTDHILFIAAGAFHVSKPSDLIPELQGRFPIRVELESLGQEDLKRILIEPKNSLIKQYTALLATEGLHIEFSEEAIDYITEVSADVNERTENIGARRLHTIMEKVLEDLLFDTVYINDENFIIDKKYVQERLNYIAEDEDLSRYIL